MLIFTSHHHILYCSSRRFIRMFFVKVTFRGHWAIILVYTDLNDIALPHHSEIFWGELNAQTDKKDLEHEIYDATIIGAGIAVY